MSAFVLLYFTCTHTDGLMTVVMILYTKAGRMTTRAAERTSHAIIRSSIDFRATRRTISEMIYANNCFIVPSRRTQVYTSSSQRNEFVVSAGRRRNAVASYDEIGKHATTVFLAMALSLDDDGIQQIAK